jgi:hypothetical protein
MVSTFERQISLGGIFSIYAYVCYKFVTTRKNFDKKFHEAMITQGTKFEKEINSENFKFVQTPNEKILFLLGIENNKFAFKNENMMIIENLIENFTPNAIVYERDLKL